MSQASKAPIQHGMNFGFVGWASILEVLFDISMAVLFRVDLWRIGWLACPPRTDPTFELGLMKGDR